MYFYRLSYTLPSKKFGGYPGILAMMTDQPIEPAAVSRYAVFLALPFFEYTFFVIVYK